MIRHTLLATVLLFTGSARAEDLVFPNGAKETRLRVEVIDGQNAPDATWTAFLDRLFAYFDRNTDGVLSEAEAKRVFTLPLPGGRVVTPDFAAMDADADRNVTPAEFRAFYRKRGFTPVTVVVQTALADALVPGEALFRHLDRNADGKLSAAELRQAVALLKRFDEDEDEVLIAQELPGGEAVAAPAGVKLITAANGAADAVLRLALDGKTTLTTEGVGFNLSSDNGRLTVPGGTCRVAVAPGNAGASFRAAKNFYLAQFKSAAGDQPASKALFEDDPTAQVLTGLFDAADRNGDGKLSRAELEAFFDLVELGVRCRVVVTVSDRGRNLFDLFDADGNGRLDLGELLRAAKALPIELAGSGPLAREAVPASYRLVAGRGPVGDSFGPVPFGAIAEPKPAAIVRVQAPNWFRAMDKNGDGFVSAHEFVGPPALFARFDANGDGRISAEEAGHAEP